MPAVSVLFFSIIERSVLMALVLQRYVRRRNDAKNSAILSFFFVTEKNPVKCSACVVSQKIAIE